MSSSLGDGPPLLFLAADQRRTAAEMAKLLPLLWQVIGMAWARIEKLERLRRQAGQFAELEQRASERTAELDQANSSLRIAAAERERLELGLHLAGVAVSNATEGVLVTDSKLTIVAVNGAFCEISGYTAAEAIGQQASLLKSGRHGREFYEAMWDAIRGGGRWQGEIWNRRKDGELYPARLSISVVRDERQQVTNYVGALSDLSAIKASEARFDFLAHHDPLTGLPNRLLFTALGESALERAGRDGGRVAVLVIDLDINRFEDLDDTIGRPAGEGLLRKLGERLVSCVRSYDTVGYVGGDEFTVLLEKLADATSAATVARKILDALAVPFNVGGNEIFVSSCIGVSVFPEDGDALATLVKQATSAMHRAKGQARGSLEFYTAELTRSAVERFRLECDLRQALSGNELLVHYQPQVSISTGQIVGIEALVRWRHADLGLVPPAQLIQLAEEVGLVERLDAWVMRAACRQVRAWMAAGLPALRVAVNLSGREISASTLTARIAAILLETGLDARLLEVEITEGSLIANFGAALEALEAVKAMGVTIALDDFGTGYSSLNYLRRFPIDRLKLDGSFVRQVADDPTSQALARAAIELGHGLRLGVVAEGVETPEQLEFLRATGCDVYQGHLFSAAVPPEELALLLRGVSP